MFDHIEQGVQAARLKAGLETDPPPVHATHSSISRRKLRKRHLLSRRGGAHSWRRRSRLRADLWDTLRDRWLFNHLIRTIAGVLAFVCFVAGVSWH